VILEKSRWYFFPHDIIPVNYCHGRLVVMLFMKTTQPWSNRYAKWHIWIKLYFQETYPVDFLGNNIFRSWRNWIQWLVQQNQVNQIQQKLLAVPGWKYGQAHLLQPTKTWRCRNHRVWSTKQHNRFSVHWNISVC